MVVRIYFGEGHKKALAVETKAGVVGMNVMDGLIVSVDGR